MTGPTTVVDGLGAIGAISAEIAAATEEQRLTSAISSVARGRLN